MHHLTEVPSYLLLVRICFATLICAGLMFCLGAFMDGGRPLRVLIALACVFAPAVATAAGPATVIEFKASWCHYCKQMEPMIQAHIKAGYAVRQIDGEQNPELARMYNVKAYPTFFVVRDGQLLGRVDKALNQQQFRALFDYQTKAGGQP